MYIEKDKRIKRFMYSRMNNLFDIDLYLIAWRKKFN
jgi:hypothetical protein